MNRLKLARGRSGLTLRELSKIANVNPETINELENDKRRAHIITLGKLAKALAIDLEDLSDLIDDTATERGRVGGQIAARNRISSKTDQNRSKITITEPEISLPGPTPKIPPITKPVSPLPQEKATVTATEPPAPPRTRPLKYWTFLEDGSHKEFKQYQLARQHAFSSGQRARIYEGTQKNVNEAYATHKKFIDDYNNALAEWSKLPQTIKLPDPEPKNKKKSTRPILGPATCSECGKPAVEGSFLCPRHMKEK